MNSLQIPILLNDDVSVPSYAYPGDAAVDLCATKSIVLKPFERALIPTGISVEIPRGYAGLVLPRSGMAIKYGLSLVNSPGLIDSDYRGEIQVIAINLDGSQEIIISKGDRIAQLMIVSTNKVEFTVCDHLEKTDRDDSGFGSSGV